MRDQLEFTVVNRAGEITRAQERLEEFAAAHGFPARQLHEAQVALEEHLTNVVNHGYADAAEHQIRIELSFRSAELCIRVEDDGRAFDPLAHPAPNLALPLDQRPIGGLGIYMMRKSLDGLEYHREQGKNILVMTKRI